MWEKNKSILFAILLTAASFVLFGCYTQISRPGLNNNSDEGEGYYTENDTEEDNGIGVQYETEEADTHVVVHHVYEHMYEYDFYWDTNWRYYYRPWRPYYTWYPYWRAPYYDPWYWDYPYAYIDVFYWTPFSYYNNWAYHRGYWDGYYFYNNDGPGVPSVPTQRRSFDRRHPVAGVGAIQPQRANPRLAGADAVVTGIPRRGSTAHTDQSIGRDSRRNDLQSQLPTPGRRSSTSRVSSTESKVIEKSTPRSDQKNQTIERRRSNRGGNTGAAVDSRDKKGSSQSTPSRSRTVTRKSTDNSSQKSGNTGGSNRSGSQSGSISRSRPSGSSSGSGSQPTPSRSGSSSSSSSRSSGSSSSSSKASPSKAKNN